MSAHLELSWEIPASLPGILDVIVLSRVLMVMFFSFCEASIDLTLEFVSTQLLEQFLNKMCTYLLMILIKVLSLVLVWNWSLTWPLTQASRAILGSWTNEEPLELPGGQSPVLTYFKHSGNTEYYYLKQTIFPQHTYNCSLATSILSKNQSERREELNVLSIILCGSKGTNSLDLHLLDFCHDE